MKELTEKAQQDSEKAASEISSVPKDREDIVTALSKAFKDGLENGIRVGTGMNEKEPA